MKYLLGARLWPAAAVALVCATAGARGAGDNTSKPVHFAQFDSAPLCFEARGGQDGASQFIARGAKCSVFLAPAQAEIVVGNSRQNPATGQERSMHSVRLKLVGANALAKMTGRDQLSARANYFIGNDPAQWRAGIPLFSHVQADDIYPGVQVIYYANQAGQMEYDFILQPGARPEQIRFGIEGADKVQVDTAGNLLLKIGSDEILQHPPVVYQQISGERREIPAGYHLNRDGTIGLALAGYDRSSPLTIDPVLDFLTYLGRDRVDLGWAIALDASNNIYVTGETQSKNLPATNAIVFFEGGTNRVFTNFQGGTGGFGDAFVASYDTTGSLRYLTYLGGRNADGALGIAADGNAAPDGTEGVWLTGFTDSGNFPLTPDAIRTKLTGPNNNALRIFPTDAFIAHVDATGSNLLYSTFFGGSNLDEGVGIYVYTNNLGSTNSLGVTNTDSVVYVTGFSNSGDLTGVTSLINGTATRQTNLAGHFDAFVTELINGTNRFTTYLGGTNQDYGLSIAVDSASNSWITGLTFSTNFPTTNWEVLSSNFEADIANATTNLFESSHDFAGLNNQVNTRHHNTSFHSDAFVSELSPDGTNLLFSIYLGGTNDDFGSQITVDSSDHVYVTGFTFCRDFPTNVVTGLFFPDFSNNVVAFPGATVNFFSHVFVTEFTNENGTNVIGYSTSFGGNSADRGTAIAVDANGNAYVTGSTSSTNFFHTNAVILTNSIEEAGITNKHGVFTNFNGIRTNNPTFADLSNTNYKARLNRFGGNSNDIFVAVLSPDGRYFSNSIILGGPGVDTPNGIAVDPAGSAVYIVGSTTSRTNFATTNAFQPFFGRGKSPNVFIGKIQLFP